MQTSPEAPSQPDLTNYDRIVVFFSGGKDSVACVLHLLDLGVPRSKIELQHHDIDGREGSSLMDWPVTPAYVQAFGDALGLPVYFSWRVGGFERELKRENCGTAPITFTRGDGTLVTMGGERSKANTRRRFPQVSADLRVRWCSSSLKIEPGDRLLCNDTRFMNSRTLVVTGERAEESPGRARYSTFEPHRKDLRHNRSKARHIDHWRPVHAWSEERVWKTLERHRIHPHACYYAGINRASCMKCIFGNDQQWATIKLIDPQGLQVIADLEQEFNCTIHRKDGVLTRATRALPHPTAAQWAPVVMSKTWDLPIFVDTWTLPAGAYGEGCGPT